MVPHMAAEAQVDIISRQIAKMFLCKQADSSKDNGEKQDADNEPLARARERRPQRRPRGRRMLSIKSHHNKHRQSDSKCVNAGFGNKLIRVGQYIK